jgi:ferredoxin
MENGKCGCEAETVDESIENVPEENNKCGCGAESIDESHIVNPSKPKIIVEEDYIEKFENYAHSIGIKSIGYTQVPCELINTGNSIMYPNAIVLTMEMDKKIIDTAPGQESQKLNDSAYEELGKKTYMLSDYLRENGFATQAAHPYDSLVKFSPLAQKASLGGIGKSGLLITPELGPRQKISAIFVNIENLPIKKDDEHSWIEDYCDKCGKCIQACPEKAMIEKKYPNKPNETEFNAKLCIGCSDGCTYCIEECPFDQKEYTHIKNRFDKMNAKLMEQNLKNQ